MHEVRHVLRRIYEDRLDLRFENRPERIAGRRIAASRLIFIRRDTHRRYPFALLSTSNSISSLTALKVY